MEEPREARELARRIAALRLVGFSESGVDALAARPEIAYLEALALLRRGFTPEVAASMLLDRRRSVF